jgi:iron-sulfur cluster repair protein YtfE (RIC family)
MTNLPTDPIREEHRELMIHLQHVEDASVQVTGWDLSQALRQLPGIVGFLRDDLLPHAAAEEQILYPTIDRLQGAATTATMIVDHIEIGELIERLAADVDGALADWHNRDLVAGVSRQLAALAAIVGLHFRKEEEVLLPVLDGGLSVEEGHELFGRMGHTAHVH